MSVRNGRARGRGRTHGLLLVLRKRPELSYALISIGNGDVSEYGALSSGPIYGEPLRFNFRSTPAAAGGKAGRIHAAQESILRELEELKLLKLKPGFYGGRALTPYPELTRLGKRMAEAVRTDAARSFEPKGRAAKYYY